MSLMFIPRGTAPGSGTQPEAINLPDVSAGFFSNDWPHPTRVYSGIKFGADGWIYKRQYAGDAWSVFATWLNIGTNSDFDILATTQSGTLTTDAGQTALIMSSDRIWDCQIQEPNNYQTATVQFDVIDAATNAITYATNTYIFHAENT